MKMFENNGGNVLFCFFSILIFGFGISAQNEPSDFRSPLDTNYVDYYQDKNIDGMLEDTKPLIPSIKDMALMPECQRSCTNQFNEVLTTAVKATNHFDRFNGVCNKYTSTVDCISKLQKCSNSDLFDMSTSGLKYMCIEQRAAFEEAIECIDAASNEVNVQCNEKCNTHGKFAKWAMSSGIFQPSVEGKSKALSNLSPDFLRGVFRDGCEMMRCQLDCMKTRFDQICKNSAGSLLSETFVRPIAHGQQTNSFTAFTSVMGMFVPEQCSFMMNEHELNKFRIDPKIDEELRKVAAERAGADHANSTFEIGVVGAVVTNMNPVEKKQSPLDGEDYY